MAKIDAAYHCCSGGIFTHFLSSVVYYRFLDRPIQRKNKLIKFCEISRQRWNWQRHTRRIHYNHRRARSNAARCYRCSFRTPWRAVRTCSRQPLDCDSVACGLAVQHRTWLSTPTNHPTPISRTCHLHARTHSIIVQPNSFASQRRRTASLSFLSLCTFVQAV